MAEHDHQAKEHRCSNCRRLLIRSDCIEATIDCPKCKTPNAIRYFTQQALMKLRIIDNTAS